MIVLAAVALLGPVLGDQVSADTWRTRFKELALADRVPKFEQAPSVRPPYSAGKLQDNQLSEGLRYLNFLRALAGIPDDISFDPTLNEGAQEAAMVLASVEELSHQPRRPQGIAPEIYLRATKTLGQSNLSFRLPKESLRGALRGQMLDDDADNMTSVGHRRWLLNPYMKVTGMGLAVCADGDTSYAVVFAFDQSRETLFSKPFVAWPPEGHMPLELLSARMPWTISLNEDLCASPEEGQIEIKLSAKGKTWTWRPKDQTPGSATAAYARIDRRSFGIPQCLVFRPEAGIAWAAGDRYQVEVTGVRGIGGAPIPIQYSGEIFSLGG